MKNSNSNLLGYKKGRITVPKQMCRKLDWGTNAFDISYQVWPKETANIGLPVSGLVDVSVLRKAYSITHSLRPYGPG